MRMLHRLAGHAAIWPFVAPGPVTVVEIFPRLYFKRARVDPRAWRDPAMVNAAPAAFDSPPHARLPPHTQDQLHPVPSAAAPPSLPAHPPALAAPPPPPPT